MVCGLVMDELVMVELVMDELVMPAFMWVIEAFEALAALLLMSPK